MLTDSQIKKITDDIRGTGISNKDLEEDLIDHVSSFIEHKMSKGIDFEAAFMEAKQAVYPNGAKEIESETLFLLNNKRIKIMKALTMIIGFLSTAAVAAGSMFKILHLPGASELLMYGLISFGLLFVPLYFILRYRFSLSNSISLKSRYILGISSIGLIALSSLMKVLHLQGAPTVLLIGTTLFIVGFLPTLFWGMYKGSASK